MSLARDSRGRKMAICHGGGYSLFSVADLEIRPGVTIAAAHLHWSVARASGPGGQNVNKVSSKVWLHYNLAECTALYPAAKRRLREAHPSKVDRLGNFKISSQKTRDQSRNKSDALERLRVMVAAALVRPKPRRATKPTRGSKERRLASKRRNSQKKGGRGRIDRSDYD